MVKATVLSFRRGRHNQRTNQFLLEVPGCDTRAKAAKLIGKKVSWTTQTKKKITGSVAAPHGNSGVVRARFVKGLPGTALATKADIED